MKEPSIGIAIAGHPNRGKTTLFNALTGTRQRVGNRRDRLSPVLAAEQAIILSHLGAYLAERKRAPIGDLANRFDSEPDAIRGMLEHYIRKGRVRRLDGGGACSGCRKREAFVMEIYEWTGEWARR